MNTSLRESILDLLYLEGELLDDRRWEDWFMLYAEDCEYWLPSWDSDLEYTSDPNNELSLMYYDSRIGLEDRAFRLNTGASSASTPFPRTSHMVSNVRPKMNDDGTCAVKANWVVNYFRLDEAHRFFGQYEYLLTPIPIHERNGMGIWKIQKKKTIVQNDRIPMVLDIYHV